MYLHCQTSTYLKKYQVSVSYATGSSYVNIVQNKKILTESGTGLMLVAEINELGDTIKTQKIIAFTGGIGGKLIEDIEANLWLNGSRIGVTPYTQSFLSKLDNSYKPLTAKFYSSPTGHLSMGFNSAIDTTFLGVGYITQGGWNTPIDMALIKVDKNGDTIWCKKYDDGGNLLVASCSQNIPFSGGSSLILGATRAIDTGDVVLSKVDNSGNVLWSKAYGGNVDEGATILYRSNNSFYIMGASTSFDGGNVSDLLIKTDTLGNLIWAKSISSINGFGNQYGIYEPSRGVFTLTGISNYSTTNWGFLAMQIDTNGVVVNNKKYEFSPDNDYGLSFVKMNDGGYLFTLSEYNNSILTYDTKIFKADSLFNSGCLPNTTLSFTTTDVTPLMHVNTLSMVASPLYIDVIDTVTFGSGRGCVILPECNGFVEVDESKANENEFLIYPNPANSFIDIETEFKNYSISVFDNMGKLILKEETNQNEIRIDISSFSTGIYFIQLQSNHKLVSKKFIKE